jgi:hypothetical protein
VCQTEPLKPDESSDDDDDGGGGRGGGSEGGSGTYGVRSGEPIASYIFLSRDVGIPSSVAVSGSAAIDTDVDPTEQGYDPDWAPGTNYGNYNVRVNPYVALEPKIASAAGMTYGDWVYVSYKNTGVWAVYTKTDSFRCVAIHGFFASQL